MLDTTVSFKKTMEAKRMVSWTPLGTIHRNSCRSKTAFEILWALENLSLGSLCGNTGILEVCGAGLETVHMGDTPRLDVLV